MRPPDRVQAIAPGGVGFFTLPEDTHDDTPINWSVGINNLRSLVGQSSDAEAYNDVKQFFFAADHDPGCVGHGCDVDSLDREDLALFWESLDQVSFVQRFGSTPLLREESQISYLNSRRFSNISLHTYPGGHGATPAAIAMVMNFFINEAYPKSIPSQDIPPSSGFGIRWPGIGAAVSSYLQAVIRRYAWAQAALCLFRKSLWQGKP